MKKRITIDHANTNKQLRHYDAEGDYMRLSVDETIARGLNAWSGWTCSAGVKNLYIDYDGNLWVCNTASGNTNRFNFAGFNERRDALFAKYPEGHPDRWPEFEKMKVSYMKSEASAKKIFEKGSATGMLGNIFDGFELPSTWMTCPWKLCACGADVFIPKSKTEQDGHVLAVHNRGLRGQHATVHQLVDQIEQENLVGVEPNFPIPHQILWDLGRKCNYDCSYCWPHAHNRDAEHKPLEVMVATADKLISEWAGNGQIRWNFGGGEPTLNPDFLAFLRYLKDRNQWVLVTTNGSRPRKYWQQAIQFMNSVNLSVHFEFSDDDKLMGNIEEICAHFDEHNDDHWLEIKLMAPPNFVQRAVDLRERIKTSTTLLQKGANGRVNGAISIVPIRLKGGVVADYEEEDIKIIQNQ